MMKILDTILKIEDDSKAKVVDAQKKARELKEAAENENTERLHKARAQAASSLTACVNKAKKEWQEKYEQTVLSQDSEHTDFIDSKRGEIDNAADKILTIIKNPRYKNIDD